MYWFRCALWDVSLIASWVRLQVQERTLLTLPISNSWSATFFCLFHFFFFEKGGMKCFWVWRCLSDLLDIFWSTTVTKLLCQCFFLCVWKYYSIVNLTIFKKVGEGIRPTSFFVSSSVPVFSNYYLALHAINILIFNWLGIRNNTRQLLKYGILLGKEFWASQFWGKYPLYFILIQLLLGAFVHTSYMLA